jgi:excisionase family DNA binding protein
MSISQLNKKVLSLEEARQILGISRSLIYKLAKNGEIPVLKLGSRVLIRVETVERILTEPPSER